MLQGPLIAAIIGTWMSSMLRCRWRPAQPVSSRRSAPKSVVTGNERVGSAGP